MKPFKAGREARRPKCPMTITLVLGGARSGKSRHAESLFDTLPPPWTYIATAEAFDDEMRERIAAHRDRRDARWVTVNAPLGLPAALARAEGPVLVDCLTLWLTNLMLGERDIEAMTNALLTMIGQRRHDTVFVSNEVGLGIVPDNALARRFRDAQGILNQRVAARADRVIFMAAGLPMVLK
jgi:adenosylcobinamide kinase / adenosylcobinamide-phosphate guanylyltransferase